MKANKVPLGNKLNAIWGTGNLSVLVGAAFLMATSAIGPGFLTQTATFTEQYTAAFGFVILASTVLSFVAQINVWRIIAVSKCRGQDVANKIFPGLGYVIAALVAIGGLAFNIGNVGGAALGLNVLFDLDVKVGALLVGIMGVIVFASKNIGAVVDKFSQVTGAIMLVLISYVAIASNPPVAQALKGTVMPEQIPTLAILTLVGGTVGGYITFSGGHRLVDAGITGQENLQEVNRSAILGMGVATFVRILLFLAALGVVATGSKLDPGNPAASVFQIAAGAVGFKIFGVIFFSESLNSVVGAAYTSVSFLKTLFKVVNDFENRVIIGFIAISALIFIIVGQPVKVLIVVGALNALILPITLLTMLVASKRKDIVGDYQHPQWLFVVGLLVVAITGFMGIRSLGGIAQLWLQ